jgi:hypothetical protein
MKIIISFKKEEENLINNYKFNGKQQYGVLALQSNLGWGCSSMVEYLLV